MKLPLYNTGDPVFLYKLMLKQHFETGISYLCVTKRTNWNDYTGSGIRWKYLLNKYPSSIISTLLYTSDDITIFNSICLIFSNFFEVDKNKDFANIIPEYGYNKEHWGTDGQIALKRSGNRRGCATKEWMQSNPEKQKENASRGGRVGGIEVGRRLWWNNGEINKKSYKSPGQNWVRGMLMSEKKLKQIMSIAGHNKKEIK